MNRSGLWMAVTIVLLVLNAAAQAAQASTATPGHSASTMPPGAHERLLRRAEPYRESVQRWAREFDLPESLLLAVIYTESRFNPQARSHANALGLMQVIPSRAGVDAIFFLTGERRIPTEAELLDPDTNIRLGAAYLRMLKDRYWAHIEDPDLRRYLVLASYNWGVGNVRRRVQLPPELTLTPANLRAKIDGSAPAETSGYLRAVSQRALAYEQILLASSEAQVALH
jgi:membrane-bound lytic murein transglycosylase C